MARKKTTTKSEPQNELLLPALALSALSLLLVGVLATSLDNKTPETQSAASGRVRYLTDGLEVEDLEADLEIISEDSLETEVSILEDIK